MQALFLVLHKEECLDQLLVNLQSNGIQGGTIMNSTGMMTSLNKNEGLIVNSLKLILDDIRETSKVLFFILEKDRVEVAKKAINETLGDINNPNTGIMFGIDLAFVDGLIKRNP